MNQIKLQLIDGHKSLGAVELSPVLHLRLIAFARKNRLSLKRMVERAIIFTTEPDGAGTPLNCPDEEEIVELAARMLTAQA